MSRTLRAAAVALALITTMLLGTGVANAATYSFACEPPQFVGSGSCGGPFVVHPNDVVRVNLLPASGSGRGPPVAEHHRPRCDDVGVREDRLRRQPRPGAHQGQLPGGAVTCC
jgi:hypothetical protein